MSIITDEMVEKGWAAAYPQSTTTKNYIRAALEAVLPDIRNQAIEECAEKSGEGGYWADPRDIAAKLRSLKSKP